MNCLSRSAVIGVALFAQHGRFGSAVGQPGRRMLDVFLAPFAI